MNKNQLVFATTGSLVSTLFLFFVNYLTSPDYLWSLYPAFFLLLWLISLFFIQKRRYKLYAYLCSLLLIIYIIIENILSSPEHPWFLYAAYPIIWWPISLSVGKRVKTLKYAWTVSIITILYYSTLNIMLTPIVPWAIFPTYVILWWPLTLYYVSKKNYFGFSVTGSIFTILFFIIVNLVISPHTLWAIYPIFLILWWPLSMYYFSFRKKKMKSR